jgi:outer membrane immunogenic protein
MPQTLTRLQARVNGDVKFIAGATMKKLLLTSAALAALMGPVTAADLAGPVYRRPLVVAAPVYSWTGCYVGGHVGDSWFHDDETNVGAINGANFPVGTVHTYNGNGFTGGVQAGCNYQFAPAWVAGVEGDFSWGDVHGTSDVQGVINPTVVNHAQENFRWLSDVTARLGFLATNRLLLYVKGGAAWTHSDGNSITTNAAGTTLDIVTGSDTRLGWIVAGGAEYRFAPNWSVKLEYDYIDLGTQTLSGFVNFGATAPVLTGVTLLRDHTTNVQTVKVGINYLFGGVPYGGALYPTK